MEIQRKQLEALYNPSRASETTEVVFTAFSRINAIVKTEFQQK